MSDVGTDNTDIVIDPTPADPAVSTSHMRLRTLVLVAFLFAEVHSARDSWSTVHAQAPLLPIHAIQGPGARSPVEGQVVFTRGIVTARKVNGFFIQAPDGGEDADARTSEGMFVFTSTTPAANLTPGTVVSVMGRVLEFVPAADPSSPPFTELDSPSIEVRGFGAPLPTPIEIRANDLSLGGGHDQLERLEGMRVRVASLTMVSPTLGSVIESSATGLSNGVFYGVISGVERPFREPGVDIREPLPAGAPCCVPRFDGNPERIRVDSDGQPGAPVIDASTGTVLENVVGALDYGFRSYTILPDASTPPNVRPPTAGVATVRAPAGDEFSAGSLNLQRFFDTSNDPTVQDVVLTPAAFQTRLAKASLYIRRLMHTPDIIGVQEVENLATLQALAAALNRSALEAGESDPQYAPYLEEGNDPGGVDVGILVKRTRVEVLHFAQEGKSETFRNPIDGQSELLNDRPPLVLTARVLPPAGVHSVITVIVNHLRSLIDIESPTTGARVRAKRAAQAEFLAALLNRRVDDDPGERILVLGDLNAFEFNDGYVDVVDTIRGAPAPREQTVVPTRDLLNPDLVELIDALPPASRYSYVFDGTAQILDHMLVTQTLQPFVATFSYVRGNADSPEAWRSDPRRPERISDHDAALVYIRL